MQSARVHLVRSADDSYDILIGEDVLERLQVVAGVVKDGDRYVIVTDSNVGPLYGEQVRGRLQGLGVPVHLLEVPAGEASKSMQTVLDLAGRLMALQASRKTVLVALGGGVVGDLTGFVASIFKRSVPFVQIATSLVAQVDSSVGGKTGVDLPEGKNLLGTFYQPKVVFVDLRCLDTLSERDLRNGLAEIIKYGIISDASMFETLERRADAVTARQRAVMSDLVERSCRIKASIVEQDEKEGGLRRILNFGHTLGHALEAGSSYGLSHGEAVAIGIVAAAELSSRLGHLSEETCKRIKAVVQQYGLPVKIPKTLGTDEIMGFLASDKKAVSGKIYFVLIRGLAQPFVTAQVPPDIIREVIEALRP